MRKYHFIQSTIAAFLFTCGCMAFHMTAAYAQQPPWVHTNETVLPEPQLPDQFESNDSLNEVDSELSEMDSLQEPKVSFADVDFPTFEDSIYSARLNSIVSPIPLTYNDEVKKYINLYVLNRREQVSRMLGLSKIYFPIFDQIFAEYGIPPEIKYLSIIESALNPHAVSRVGATGMWQFMYGTARQYGLNINSYVDERKDLIRSTEGAAQYLKCMYDVYGDWLLAIASYNCGPGNVNRAISLSGGNTFWEIRNYLPKETRNYVPAFIAATYVMTYYDLHDLYPDYPKYCFEPITTVNVSDKMSCDQIAKFTGLSMEEFKFLNPGLKCSVIPGGNVYAYDCKLPSDRIGMFDNYRDSIIQYSLNAKPVFDGGYIPGARITYTVRKGDNLGKIAAKYHVSVSQLKKWNNLHSSTIRAGQHLKINTRQSAYASSTTASSKSNTTSNSKTSAKSTAVAQQPAKGSENEGIKNETYVVRKGDYLNKVAAEHHVSVADIKTWNQLSTSTIIPGQRLKLYNPALPDSTQGEKAANEKTATVKTAGERAVAAAEKETPAARPVTYVVKKGDYLNKIAAEHAVSVEQIRNWNQMKNTTVVLGQKLIIYPAADESSSKITANTLPSAESATHSEVATITDRNAIADETGTKEKVIRPEAPIYVYYKARNGDTLWDIAQRYGCTVDDIRKLNGASKCNNLKVGTILKLSSKG